MPPRDDDENLTPPPSLAERLRRRFGSEVDPRIDLGQESAPAPTAPGSQAFATSSSATLSRLSTRQGSMGRYRLQGEIARGGMGAILEVYDEDLRRKLAMKVILDEPGSEGSPGSRIPPVKLSRFLEEAQVTGQLDHPGIVPVHELGIDADGRVFFTMKLVKGQDLAHIFGLVAQRQNGWTQTRALNVLLKVCEAMAYAHAKGVIHRDLKPPNIMVGRYGEVHVMDWGLARVLGTTDRKDIRVRASAEAPSLVRTERREESADSSLITMDGDIVGTPAYMPPEQARGDLAAMGPASDVYAVGAILYHLLAGHMPYARPGSRPSAHAIWDMVRNGPPAPLGEIAASAPTELVAICEKAMARDPGQRYADMLELADDLRAFLEGRVVGAFETGAVAEARKWVRRNKPLAASLAAGVLALAGGLAASLVFAQRASANAQLAEERRGQADANATLAETRRAEAESSATAARRQGRIAAEVNAFLNDDLLAAVAPEHQGSDVTVREVLDQAALRLEGRFADEPAVEAALRTTIGTSYDKLGEFEVARPHLERALELRRIHEGERAEPTLESIRRVASVWAELGRTEEAIVQYELVLAVSREAYGAEHRSTLTTMNDLAIVLRRTGDMDEARKLLEEAVAADERVLGRDHADTLVARNNLALLLRDQGHFSEAVAGFEHVLERQRATLGERHPDTLNALSNLANAQSDAGDQAGAEARTREALALRKELFAPDHPMTGREYANLGTILWRRGRPAEAEENMREALRITRLRYGDDNAYTLLAQANLTVLLEDQGRSEESLPLWLASLEARRRVLGPRHTETLETMSGLAATYASLKRYEEAEALNRETLALRREVLGPDHPVTIMSLENLGNVLYSRGDAAGSEALLYEVLEARRRVLGAAHPDVAKTTFNLGMVTKARGDTAGALGLVEEALELSRAASGDVNPLVPQCLRAIGDIRLTAGERVEAIAAYREALRVLREMQADDWLAAYLIHQIGVAQYGLEDYASALASLQESLAAREKLLGPDDVGTRTTRHMVARTLVKLERFAEAEPIALDVQERALRVAGADSEHATMARKLLADLYDAWGRPAEAEKWR